MPFRPTVQYSSGVPDSVQSWQDSTFERPNQPSRRGVNTTPNKITFSVDDVSKGQFEEMKGGKLGELFASTDLLFHTGREENKRMKAIFGAISGLAIGGLLFILLYYSFDYSGLVAVVLAAVSTIFICIGLAFFPTCRCILALVFPNFSTGKGRAVFLSIIFAGMLSGPIINITHNGKETGNSLACMIDLITNQSKILLQQSKESVKEVVEHIEEQRKSLDNMKSTMFVDFKELRDNVDKVKKDFTIVDQNMNKIYEVHMISTFSYLFFINLY